MKKFTSYELKILCDEDMYLSPVEIEQILYYEMQKKFPDRLKGYDENIYAIDITIK